MIMYLITLFIAVGLLMVLAYLFASYIVDYIDDNINRRHLIIHEVVICIGIGILVTQLTLACKTYNSFAHLYVHTAPIPVSRSVRRVDPGTGVFHVDSGILEDGDNRT